MTDLTRKQLKDFMPGYHIQPVKREPKKHEESDLHLQFCKWVKKEYPDLQFVRHEREKARSKFMSNLMKVYNTDWDKLPDFEGLFASGNPYDAYRSHTGFYIEFKKPGRTWTLADGKTLAAGFEGQYKCHLHLWSIGRCAYFCNDLEIAKGLLRDYVNGRPQEVQECIIREKENNFLL